MLDVGPRCDQTVAVDRDPPTIRPLDDVLRHVSMSGIFYCPSSLSEPWGIELPPMDCLWFHVVVSGRCTIAVDGVDEVGLGPGDLVLVTQGAGHRGWGRDRVPVRSVLDLPHEDESDTYAVLRHGGGGEVTTLVCGGVRFDHPAARHLVESLPPVIHLEPMRSVRADWLRSTLELLAEETRFVRPGSDAVVSRLCDVLVLQAIRTWIERDPAARTGWLGALRDVEIGAAIAAIHERPEHQWTVETLAHEAAMSRSRFAQRFNELVGEPPMTYVARWRMYAAHALLQRGQTVAAAGRAVGYDSDAAFSRAYSRVMGAPAGEVRRRGV